MAEIGWIDFSPKDRNRVGSILDMLKPEGQVDELGIGTIRDAMADRLFPGISTIQTRAKYFFIIPYILNDFLKLPLKERKKKSPTKYLEQREYEIMWDLADQYRDHKGSGVIGITLKRGEHIVRRPSEIYWNGLNIFKCINARGLSANAFLKSANNVNLEALAITVEEEGGDDVDAGFENYFNIKVPAQPDWETKLEIELNREEASFLKDAMLDLKHSVLALVTNMETDYEIFRTSDTFNDFVKTIVNEPIPEELKKDLVLAHDFAVLMEGAHIAYNQELQKQFFQNDPFAEKWQNWYNELQDKMIDFNGFNPEDLFVYATTTKPPTAQFVKDWWNFIKASSLDEEKKIRLIRMQEGFSKKRKARLKWNNSYGVKEGKRLGLGLLQYRFQNAQVIVNDVIKGLE
jgi:hypothetical protein